MKRKKKASLVRLVKLGTRLPATEERERERGLFCAHQQKNINALRAPKSRIPFPPPPQGEEKSEPSYSNNNKVKRKGTRKKKEETFGKAAKTPVAGHSDDKFSDSRSNKSPEKKEKEKKTKRGVYFFSSTVSFSFFLFRRWKKKRPTIWSGHRITQWNRTTH